MREKISGHNETKKANFKISIILSVILHVVIIALFFLGAMSSVDLMQRSAGGGTKIDAIMVDPTAMAQQYQRKQQQQKQAEMAELKRKQLQDQQDNDLLVKKQQEQERLKQLEKERLASQEVARKAAEEKQRQELAAKAAEAAKQQAEQEARQAKLELEKQQQLALMQKRKAEEEAKQRAAQAQLEKDRIAKELKAAEEQKKAQEEATKRAEQARLKAEAEKQQAEQAAQKAKNEAIRKQQEVQQKIKDSQREQEVQDIIGGLTAQNNQPNNNQQVGSGGVSQSDVDYYKGLLHDAIQNKFKDPQLFRGKECFLHIKLAPDGMLINVQAKSGDPALCREAVVAISSANIPAPQTKAIYEVFKDSVIEFKPD